jgi:hypothetical protein
MKIDEDGSTGRASLAWQGAEGSDQEDDQD